MSALYGSLTGDASRTDATRRGHNRISGHVRGWNCGLEVEGSLDSAGREQFEVYLTSGSSGAGRRQYLGRAYIGAGGRTFVYDPGEAPSITQRTAASEADYIRGEMERLLSD